MTYRPLNLELNTYSSDLNIVTELDFITKSDLFTNEKRTVR